VNIKYLDHIALRVEDLTKSSEWYQTVLGLKEYKLEAWGDFPIFLLAGKSGLALFPKRDGENPKPDHFAFNIDYEEFKKAKDHLSDLEIAFEFQDHIYFHSIYFKDPDNHTVELTTLVVDENKFYKD